MIFGLFIVFGGDVNGVSIFIYHAGSSHRRCRNACRFPVFVAERYFSRGILGGWRAATEGGHHLPFWAAFHFFAKASFCARLRDFTEYSRLEAADLLSDAVKATSLAGRWARTYADPLPQAIFT